MFKEEDVDDELLDITVGLLISDEKNRMTINQAEVRLSALSLKLAETNTTASV